MNPELEPALPDEPAAPSPEALDAEIDDLRGELAAAVDGDERAEVSAALGVSLLDRYQFDGAAEDAADLHEAVDRLSEALAGGSPDHPDRTDWTALLGVAHGLRFDLTMDPADRDLGIQALTEGLGGLPVDDPELGMFRMILGNLCWERGRTGAGPGPGVDLQTAVDNLGAVLHLPDLEPAARLEVRTVLGLAHALRHQQTGDREDLDAAIGHLADVLGPEPAGTGPPGLALELGRLLWVRGTLSASREDTGAAIRRFRHAVDRMPSEDPDRWHALLLLGSACLERGVDTEGLRWTGGFEDLDTIVDCFTELLPVLPVADVPRARVVAALGFARFQRAAAGSGQPDDLEAALGYLEEAADTLDDVAEQLPTFRTVAMGVLDGCRRGFHPSGMRLVLKLLTRVSDELPDDDQTRLEAAAELGVAMVLAFDLGQLPSGLDPAVERLDRLLAAAPGGLPQLGVVHAALGAVLARRAVEGTHPADIDRGIEHLRRALELLPPGHRERPGTEVNLATALYARFQQRHQVGDLDAADERLRACRTGLDQGSPAWAAAKAVFGGILVVRANYRQDAELADEAVTVLQECQEVVPPFSPLRAGVDQGLGMALLLRSQLKGSAGDREAAIRWLDSAAETLPPDAPTRRVALATAGMAKVARDPDNPSVESFDAGVEWLREAVTSSPRDDLEQAMNMASLGGLLFGRHMVRNRSATDSVRRGDIPPGAVDLALDDLNEAIRWMEAAGERVPDRPATAWWSLVSLQLCMALRRRSVFEPDDRRRSREVGLEGLRGFAWRVLLQAGTEDAMAAARDAAGQALEIAGWCLDDGALDQAVEALESGRGLVLHAATASATIAGQLRDTGHHQLAAEWETALASPAPQPVFTADLGQGPDRLAGIPSDLPFRVLRALEGADLATGSRQDARPRGAGGRLLVPPSTGEVRDALEAFGADALVFLVPRSELADDAVSAARAVVVALDGPTAQLDLPLLEAGSGTPLDDYVAALDARRRTATAGAEEDRRAALGRWRRSLEALCDWAWGAAVGPLLELTAGWGLGRPARLVLVPFGLLGLVPWHAARVAAAGGRHQYAVQQAMFSYAASARLLCEVAARKVLPRDGRGLVVGDPTGTLDHAVQEALALYGTYYPDAAYLGRPSDVAVEAGTPGQVLRRLSSGDQAPPVQHLACHAFIEDSPARTHLLLAGMQKLTVGDLLAGARGRRPGAPGATVSLAACTTNLAGRQHDESLTLATAFLVAGAASVVGSLWQVPDLRTSLLMFMTHHYLNEAGEAGGDALRRAQLWMLDPQRQVPASMPAALAGLVHSTDLTAPHGWAGFTHQGW
jgi:hypothetical protein